MTRTRKPNQTSKKNINEEPETNSNNLLSSLHEKNTDNNILQDTISSHNNAATTSNALPLNTDPSFEVPPEVKRYINAAFEKQTLEIKALFQRLQTPPSFSFNNPHDLNSDSDANSNRGTNNNINNNNEPTSNLDRRTSKRPAPNLNDNHNNINNVNNHDNKKSRSSQDEQLSTNTFPSLKDAEDMLRGHTQGNASNVTFSIPNIDVTSSRSQLHLSSPSHEQNNLTQTQNSTVPPS